ncbi:M12 family metallo-peptidase [Denitratimonas sp. CY0512]|uniref:M12 family metallo-peptidase n=1 Tax=Denitratimonas sp. CY0512 TaxID=3131940 RepID=UPI0030B1A2E1
MITISHSAGARILALVLAGLPAFAFAQTPLTLRLDADDLARLKGLSAEATVQATLRNVGAPAEGKAKSDWTFRRIEVYADDAQLWVSRAEGLEPAPRSALRHYIGSRPGERIALSLMPDGNQGEGLLLADDGTYRLEVKAARGGLRLTGTSTDAALPDGSLPESDCMGGLHGPVATGKLAGLNRIAQMTEASPAAAKAATRRVTLALDTDNELLNLKFNNNTTNASNYLAALVAGMSAFYELDAAAGGAQLQLQIGHQILRPSTTADPYPSAPGSSMSDQLNEFGGYWKDNYSAVPRAFALMISGKIPGGGAQGIAWLLTSGNFCDATGTSWGGQTFGHYSVNRVFISSSLPAAQDVTLVAHELGHNFGLDHTHCTNTSGARPASTNTLDQCSNFEGSIGCYNGPTSCPSSGAGAPRGTLMSYCHLLTCGGSYQNAGLFHPVQVTILNSRIASQPASCVLPLGTSNQPPTITTPASFTVTEDVASSLNGISFADPDAGSGSLTATFTVPTGSLSAPSSGGVVGGGTPNARTLQGSRTALNSYLAGGNVRYTTALNATANVTLSIAINDNGHSGSGGAQSDSVSRTITVNAVNDAPTLLAPAFLPVFTTGNVPVSGVVFADVDAGGGGMTVTLVAPSGVTLSGASGGGVTASGSGGTRTFNGSLSALNSYFAAGTARMSGPGFTGPANLQITINDNGNTGSGGAKSASASVQLRGGILFANGFE